jgi:hypothetical protein
MSRSACVAAMLAAAAAGVAEAGVTNPDISVIGQPFVSLGGPSDEPGHDRPRLDVGEVEFVFEAYLNPYARGYFRPVVGAEGLELEEANFSLLRGLPLGLGLKGGRYRVGFGRFNQVHPHAVPFAARFAVLAAYLPGEEALIENGVALSRRLALAGESSLELSADWLQGDSFRIARDVTEDPGDPLAQAGGDDRATEPRPAFAARIAGFAPFGEQSGLEIGASAAGGTNNVAAGARTVVIGADFKVKHRTGARSYLLVQGEALRLDREDAGWDAAAARYTNGRHAVAGGYLYADYAWAARWSAGASWEGFERPAPGEKFDQAVGIFAGFSLLEETTAFRLDWRRAFPDHGRAWHEITLRAIYSMGPHKAHTF